MWTWNLDFTKKKIPFFAHLRSSGAMFILYVFLNRISSASEITLSTSSSPWE